MMMMRLKGQSILVVEHEPSVARELEEEFTQAGAKVFAAGQLRDALYLAEYPALSAAVVNVQMGGGGESTAAVCHRLAGSRHTLHVLHQVRLDRGGQHLAAGAGRRQAGQKRHGRGDRRRPAAHPRFRRRASAVTLGTRIFVVVTGSGFPAVHRSVGTRPTPALRPRAPSAARCRGSASARRRCRRTVRGRSRSASRRRTSAMISAASPARSPSFSSACSPNSSADSNVSRIW